MGAYDFNDLKRHIGHRIVCVPYGRPPANVSVECEDCNEVLLDYDRSDASPMDMVHAREEQSEVKEVRDDIRHRQGKPPKALDEADRFVRFINHARPLLESAYVCRPNVLEITRSRGVQTFLALEGEKVVARNLPLDSEYMLTIRVGRCFHQMENGVCKKCGIHQKDEEYDRVEGLQRGAAEEVQGDDPGTPGAA